MPIWRRWSISCRSGRGLLPIDSTCPTALTNYRKILKDPAIEAVSVCLPNVLHAPVTIACLQAGKHVLCEKPIAVSLKQAERRMRPAWTAGRGTSPLAIGVVNRYDDNVNWVRETIAAWASFGRVVYHVHTIVQGSIRSITRGLGGWFTTKKESGGGVMFDWGVHFIDLILYCLGAPKPVAVSGAAHARLGAKPREYAYLNMWAGPPRLDGVCDVEEYVSGLLRTRGPSVAFEGAWAQNIGEGGMFIDFLGDTAGIRLLYGGGFTIYGHKDGRLFEDRAEPARGRHVPGGDRRLPAQRGRRQAVRVGHQRRPADAAGAGRFLPLGQNRA